MATYGHLLSPQYMPLRLDSARAKKWEKLPNGFLRAEASLTRVGVFEYQLKNGQTIRELRSEEEVFHPDSIASFEMLPVVVEHPDPPILTSKTAAQFTRGHLGENLRKVGDRLEGRIMVTHEDAVSGVLDGKHAEVSLGYTCALVEEAGVWNGQPYTHKQTNIRGNHVALTSLGRMGRDIRVHLDSADAVATKADPDDETTDPGTGQNKRTEEMEKVTINGVTFEVTAQVAQALRAEREAASAKTDSLVSEKTAAEKAKAEAEGKAAAAEKLAKDAEVARMDAIDPKKLDQAVEARLDLLARAGSIIGEGFDGKGKGEKEIKLEVLKHLDPEKDFSKQAPEYVAAYFDAMTAKASEARADSMAASAHATVRAAAANAGTAKSGAAKSFEEAQTRNADAWKKPIGISLSK